MNEVKEFKTVKLYKKTADRVKKHCKKNGYTIAGWLSIIVNQALKKGD